MDKDTSSYIALGAIVCVALVAIVSIVSFNGGDANTAGVPTWTNRFTGPVPGTGGGSPQPPCVEGTFTCVDYIRTCDIADVAAGICSCAGVECGRASVNLGPRKVMECVKNSEARRSFLIQMLQSWGFSGKNVGDTVLRYAGICPEETTCTENPPECRDAAGNVITVIQGSGDDGDQPGTVPEEDQPGENGQDDSNQYRAMETPGTDNSQYRAPPGGTVTNVNSGGSFGCDWESELDLTRCSGPTENNELEVYSNTHSCVQQGDEVVYTINLRGLEHPDQHAPVDEHFSRKQGAEVTIYNFHRSCTDGGQVQNQHSDLIYDCQVYESCTCSPTRGIECGEDTGGDDVVVYPTDETPVDEPYILQEY